MSTHGSHDSSGNLELDDTFPAFLVWRLDPSSSLHLFQRWLENTWEGYLQVPPTPESLSMVKSTVNCGALSSTVYGVQSTGIAKSHLFSFHESAGRMRLFATYAAKLWAESWVSTNCLKV